MQKEKRVLVVAAWSAFVLMGVGGCGKKKDAAPPVKSAQAVPATPTAAKAAEWWAGDEDLWMRNDHDELTLWVEVDRDEGDAPLPVRPTVTSLMEKDLEKIEARYAWDFGDGSPVSHAAHPTHVYKKPGDYEGNVRMIDAVGRFGHAWFDITVTAPGAKPAAKEATTPGGKPAAKATVGAAG